MRIVSRILIFALMFLATSAHAGCGHNVKITHDVIEASKKAANMTIQVGELAANSRKEAPNLVGTVTFSVLGIPVGDVKTRKPLPEVMHPFIVDALEAAGYAVVDVRGKKVADVPVLRGEVKTFWFGAYTWIVPFMYYGGNVEYRLVLQTAEGAILWEKALTSSAGSMSSWSGAIRPAVTSLLDQIVAEVGTEKFQSALRGQGINPR